MDGTYRNLVGVIIKVTLHQNNGGALIAGAGGQVAKRADQVRQTAGGSTLGSHRACQIALFADALLDGLLQRLTGQVGKVVVSQILQLQFVGGTLQTGGVGSGNTGVSQLDRKSTRLNSSH